MAEDSPSRFLCHEVEVEGESDDDEIPKEWPAYRRAYAALCRARRTARMGSWEATGKSSQTPVARHRWVRTRRECDDSDRRIWPSQSGDHTRSWSKSCVMPFEREKAAA